MSRFICACVLAACGQSALPAGPPLEAEFEADSDADGIEDSADKCPDTAAHTEDGCPKRPNDVICSVIPFPILDTIAFAQNVAATTARQELIVDALAATIQGNPTLARLEIRGHMDKAESPALAMARATLVKEQLESRGIDPHRLSLVDLGNRCQSGARVDFRPLVFDAKPIAYKDACERWSGEGHSEPPCRPFQEEAGL